MLNDLDYNDSATITLDDVADFFRDNYQFIIDESIKDVQAVVKEE